MPECLVCGTDVPESADEKGYGATADEYGSEVASPPTVTYEGTEYVLCCGEHAEEFRTDPEQYL